MSDQQIKIVTAPYPNEFEEKVNELLKQGDWRVVQTEMSVTDHHYYAMMVQEKVENISVEEIEASAIKSMENFGAPKDMFHPDYGWILLDGEPTEAGRRFQRENKVIFK